MLDFGVETLAFGFEITKERHLRKHIWLRHSTNNVDLFPVLAFVGLSDRPKWSITVFSWIQRRKAISTVWLCERGAFRMSFGLQHIKTNLFLFLNILFGFAQTFTSDFVQFEGVKPLPGQICEATVSIEWLLFFSMLEQSFL